MTTTAAGSGRFVSSTLVARAIHRAWKTKDAENKDVRPLTAFKIIKLTYMAHGWSFVNFDRVGLVSEPVEAWKFGPVYPDLYSALASYGPNPVETVPENVHEERHRHVELSDNEVVLIDAVYEHYREFSETELSVATHMEGTPWHGVWNNGRGRFNVIDDDLIRSYYERIAEARK